MAPFTFRDSGASEDAVRQRDLGHDEDQYQVVARVVGQLARPIEGQQALRAMLVDVLTLFYFGCDSSQRRLDLALRGTRSDVRSVGKECVRTCRARWSP